MAFPAEQHRRRIVEKNGDTLAVTIAAKYGTTDASGPVKVAGTFTCTKVT